MTTPVSAARATASGSADMRLTSGEASSDWSRSLAPPIGGRQECRGDTRADIEISGVTPVIGLWSLDGPDIPLDRTSGRLADVTIAGRRPRPRPPRPDELPPLPVSIDLPALPPG